MKWIRATLRGVFLRPLFPSLPPSPSFSLGIAERGTRKPDDHGISRYFPKGSERKWRWLVEDRGKSAPRKISARDFHFNSIFRRSLFSASLFVEKSRGARKIYEKFPSLFFPLLPSPFEEKNVCQILKHDRVGEALQAANQVHNGENYFWTN